MDMSRSRGRAKQSSRRKKSWGGDHNSCSYFAPPLGGVFYTGARLEANRVMTEKSSTNQALYSHNHTFKV